MRREADIPFLPLYLHLFGSHLQHFADLLQRQGQAYLLDCEDVGQNVQHLKAFTAVSYTHLDVYKRQASP